MMKIAWELGKSLEEVENMPWDDLLMWGAFFQIVNEERKAAMDRARRR